MRSTLSLRVPSVCSKKERKKMEPDDRVRVNVKCLKGDVRGLVVVRIEIYEGGDTMCKKMGRSDY